MDRRHRLPAGRLRRGPAHPPRGQLPVLRTARRDPGDRRHLGQDRRHPLPARRLRRGPAHPPRDRAAGLRAARRHPLHRRTWGEIADIADQARATTTRPCASAARSSCRSTSGSATPVRRHHLGPARRHPYRRGDYDEALRIRREIELPPSSGSATPAPPPSPGAASPTSPTSAGDYDEALRIRREIELPVYERLGDTRDAAVTWGSIADIAYQRGELPTRRLNCRENGWRSTRARRPRRDRRGQLGPGPDRSCTRGLSGGLPPADRVGPDSPAVQRPDGIATVGLLMGQLLMAAGQADLARQVLGDARAAAYQDGWNDRAQQINDLLQPQPQSNEETSHQSRKRHRRERRVGEAQPRGMAHGWGQQITAAPVRGGGNRNLLSW